MASPVVTFTFTALKGIATSTGTSGATALWLPAPLSPLSDASTDTYMDIYVLKHRQKDTDAHRHMHKHLRTYMHTQAYVRTACISCVCFRVHNSGQFMTLVKRGETSE